VGSVPLFRRRFHQFFISRQVSWDFDSGFRYTICCTEQKNYPLFCTPLLSPGGIRQKGHDIPGRALSLAEGQFRSRQRISLSPQATISPQ
jgi:hypothetical protein